MKDPHVIIRAPMITEKSTRKTEIDNAYTFRVASSANKIEIRRAVESIFEVEVKSVNTSWQRGKRKRVGRHVGMTKAFKKAVVTLKPGHKIDLV